MKNQAALRYKISVAAIYCLLVGLSVLVMIPFVWMLTTSLKTEAQMFSKVWLPSPVCWGNYLDAVHAFPFALYLKNTLVISGWSIVGTMLSSAMVGYAFARLRWPGRDLLFVVLLSTMMIPPQVTMIPVFLLFRNLGWFNTILPLTVPTFLGGSAFFIFLMRQFFMTLPKDLEEAAKVDGCHFLRTFWSIMLPLVKPALTTIGIFTFMGTWNDFMGPLIYLAKDDRWTLALGLQSFLGEHGAEWNQLMAVSTLMMIPLLLIFFFLQRYFIEGIAMTGMKG